MKFSRLIFMLPIFIVLVILLTTLSTCTHDPIGVEGLDTVCFDTQVLPIFTGNCNSCHNYTDHASVLPLVVPGNPRSSKLYQVITNIRGENMMPKHHPLSKDMRTLIEVWIVQGAPNKKCTTQGGGGGGGGGNPKDCKDSVYFNQTILPLFTNKCATCHNGTSQGGEDALFALNDYASIRSRVSLSNPTGSSIYRVLSNTGENFMPPTSSGIAPFTSVEKQELLTWINEGARNNTCSSGTCDTTNAISYATQVSGILQTNCVGCHNSTTASGNVNLSDYNSVKTYATTLRNGTPVIIGAVKKLPGFGAMPPAYSLDACTIRTLELWIAQGTKNN
jgi:hypothetical protein